MDTKEIAMHVFVYMYERAEFEGVSHSLNEAFYQGLMDQGMRNFFGLIISEDGELLRDEQNPTFFAQFLEDLEAG